MRSRSAAVFHCGTLTLLWVAPGLAADVTADLHIDRVTVYRQGAVVTRAGEVPIPAGSNRPIVYGLPAAPTAARPSMAPQSPSSGVLGDAHVRIRVRQCRAARGTHAKGYNARAQHQ
ncbi:MAG: hypothetical protein QOJ15_5087 [Bradyrhizobium sp.]|jgi:hypothetical protein|nr:hypothetical protein [Bradyrhizobium sp.]